MPAKPILNVRLAPETLRKLDAVAAATRRTRSFIANEALEAWINREIELIEELQIAAGGRTRGQRHPARQGHAPDRHRRRSRRQAQRPPQGSTQVGLREADPLVAAGTAHFMSARFSTGSTRWESAAAACQRRYRAHRSKYLRSARSAAPAALPALTKRVVVGQPYVIVYALLPQRRWWRRRPPDPARRPYGPRLAGGTLATMSYDS